MYDCSREEAGFIIVGRGGDILIFGLSPPVKYFTDRSKAVLLCGSLVFFFCLVFAMPLCVSVYMCLVVTCREKAALLALVCGI